MARRSPPLRQRVPALAGILFLLLSAGAGAATTAETVSVDVGSAYASNEGSSIDPALANIRGKLQSMFNYTSYKMLDRQRRTLAVGQAGEYALPGRRAMRVTPLSCEGKKVRLNVQITEGSKNLLTTTLGLTRGGMVLVGGPSHQAGVLIFIISAE